MVKTKADITQERTTFKPFKFPWAYDAWLQHEQSHWLHTEVPMSEDVKDYKKLRKAEQEFLTKILRFFVQGDLDIGSYYNHIVFFILDINSRFFSSVWCVKWIV